MKKQWMHAVVAGVGLALAAGVAGGAEGGGGEGRLVAEDVVLVIDSTGSMSSAISSVKRAAAEIAEKILGATAATSGNRVGVVEYRDKGDIFAYRAATGFTTDAAAAVAAINGISVDGGGDAPEALYATLRAVAECLCGEWVNSERHIIVMTDAPPHDPDLVSGDTQETITALLTGRGISVSGKRGCLMGDPEGGFHVHVVHLGCGGATAETYGELAEDTEGTLQTCVNAGDAADAILDVLIAIEESITEASAEIAWKYLKATGTWFGRLRVGFAAGQEEGGAGLRFLFADRKGEDGETAAGLWSTARRGPVAATEEHEGTTYRAVALDMEALAAGHGEAVYGVRDLEAEGVPVEERGIELYVRKRVAPEGGNEDAAEVEDFVGYVAWESAGETHSVPVAAGAAGKKIRALRRAGGPKWLGDPVPPEELNESLAVGVALGTGAEPYCTAVRYRVAGGRMAGKLEVGASAGEAVRKGTLGSNARVAVLGAATAAGPYEELGEAETGADGTFEADVPAGTSFFRFRVDAGETVK